MNDAERIRQALRCGRSGCACRRGSNVHCPVHEDRTPSFTVNQSGERVLVNCKVGCDQATVVRRLIEMGLFGKEMAEAMQPMEPTPLERKVAEYHYIDPETGAIVGTKVRYERPDGKKTFKWYNREGKLGGVKNEEMPLYGAEQLGGEDEGPVYFVEGEKACLALRNAGLSAVCFGGGATSTSFGDSLRVLAGREVIIWPDNDEAGRKYMLKVEKELKGIAKLVRFLNIPDLPEKGDAHDYFEKGGTAEALAGYLPPSKPWTVYLAHDVVVVHYPTMLGIVDCTFSGLQVHRREVRGYLEVNVQGPARLDAPFRQRLELSSGSQQEAVTTALNGIFSRDVPWRKIVNAACGMAQDAWVKMDRAVLLTDVPDPGTPQWLVKGFVPKGMHTILYGDGATAKSYVTLYLALCCVMQQPFLGMPTSYTPVLYIDYEGTQDSMRFRLGRLWKGLHGDDENDCPVLPIFYLSASGIPFADLVPVVRQLIERHAIGMVIIDAAADACGGEPEQAHIAAEYFNSLEQIGHEVTTLTIAHISKEIAYGAKIPDRPFGSVIWRNRPRMAWAAVKNEDEMAGDMVNVGLFNTKVNESGLQRPVGYTIAFAGESGPVTIQRGSINDMPSLASKMPLTNRIWTVLTQPMATDQIAEAIGLLQSDMKGEERNKVIASVRSTLNQSKYFVQVQGRQVVGGEVVPAIWTRRVKEE